MQPCAGQIPAELPGRRLQACASCASPEQKYSQISFTDAEGAVLSSSGWPWNLEQPRTAEILGKSEGVLVLHHRFQDVCETF
jgi:hypothetical protein